MTVLRALLFLILSAQFGQTPAVAQAAVAAFAISPSAALCDDLPERDSPAQDGSGSAGHGRHYCCLSGTLPPSVLPLARQARAVLPSPYLPFKLAQPAMVRFAGAGSRAPPLPADSS